MRFVQQILFGKKPDPAELDLLYQYLMSELRLAAAQTRASERFNSAVARFGMRVLSEEADETMRREMDQAAAAYTTALLEIQQEHGALQAPEAAAEYYAAQHVVYGEHLKWSRAQEVLYQSLGAQFAVSEVQEANGRLMADKRRADKLRAKLVRYMGISRHDLNRMIREAGTVGA